MIDQSIRPHVFEGFCGECRKTLYMQVTVEKQKIVLEVVKCPKHPDDSFFLLPAGRKDIIYTNRPDLG